MLVVNVMESVEMAAVDEPSPIESDESIPHVGTGMITPTEHLQKTKEFSYDAVYDKIGGFGRWQRLLFFTIAGAELFGAFSILLPVFVGAEPNWTCQGWQNGSEPDTIATKSIWKDYNHSFSVSPVGKPKQCSWEGMTCTNFKFDDEFTSIVSEWELVCERSYISDLITTIQMIGLTIGAAFWSQMSDWFGRRKPFYLSFIVMGIPGIASGMANSWQLYALARFLVGFGFGGNMIVCVIYQMEFLGPKWRMLTGCVGYWAIGTILLTFPMAYYVREWRLLTYVSSSIWVIYLLSFNLVPESPRWLMQRDRINEAMKIIMTIADNNGRSSLSYSALLKGARSDAFKKNSDKKYTYIDLFRQWKYAKPAAIMLLAWFTVFILYYEIAFNMKNLSGNRYANMAIGGAIDWVATVSVIIVLHVFGRRKGFTFYLVFGLVSLLVILSVIVTGKEVEYGIAIVVFSVIGKSLGIAGMLCVQIISAELFPTVIRNVGVGSGSVASRIGGIVAPQFVYLGTIYSAAPYIIIAVLVAVVIPLMWLLPETKDEHLTDKYETTPVSRGK